MASYGNYVQSAIPRLDNHYDHWSMLMENFLHSKIYWSVVENDLLEEVTGAVHTAAKTKTLEDQKLKDLKPKNYLFQAIDRSILETILKKDTSKYIWDSLKKKYQGTTCVKRAQLQALRKELEILHMKEGECVNEYFARTLTVVNQMWIHGEKMEDVVMLEKILRSTTSKFDYVVCSIEESNDLDNMTIDEPQSSLLVHEQRMNSHVVEEQALQVEYTDNTGERGRGRGAYRGKGRGRGRLAFNKSIVECYHCHDLGHFQYEFPKRGKESRAHYAETSEEMLFMAYINVQKDPSEEAWFLDSECSNHVSGKKEFFNTLNEDFRESVKLGNNTYLNVMGKGSIRMQIRDVTHVITEAYYVSQLKNNLLSIG